MYFAGVDVGSVAAKAVILNYSQEKHSHQIIAKVTQPTGWSPKEAGKAVYLTALDQAGVSSTDVKKVIGTGYGRVALDFIDQAVTEITCHGLGANYYFPENNLVIDIGGQDSKAIEVNNQGKVLKFVMNDKCAAGTGRFLQVMAFTLGMELDQLEAFTLAEPITLNSMCTVFAESEVVSLLASEVAKEKIVAGLYHSIAKRTAAMTGSMGVIKGITFTGGVAKNQGMQKILAKVLNCRVDVPTEPQLIGAIGAALQASKEI